VKTEREKLQQLLEAAVQAAFLAACAMHGVWALSDEDAEANRRREGEAAHRALMDALAEFDYRECYRCGAPTAHEELTVITLSDGRFVRECPDCQVFMRLARLLMQVERERNGS
jgi:hypothetical protein